MNSLGNQGDVGEVMLQVAGTQRLFLPAKCASILKLVPFTNITVSEGAQLSRSIHLGHGKTLTVTCDQYSVIFGLKVEGHPLPNNPDFSLPIGVRGKYSRTCDYHIDYSLEIGEFTNIDKRGLKWLLSGHEDSDIRSEDEDRYEGQCENLELNLTLDILLPVYLNLNRLSERVDAGETFGATWPKYWHNGQSKLMRAPQDGDTVYQLELRGATNMTANETVKGDEGEERPRKRAKVRSTDSTPASRLTEGKTIKIGFSQLPTSKEDMEEIMMYLKDSLLPTTSIIGYLVTLCGGILHMSYPPTLDQLLLYCHVLHLHAVLNTPGGHVESTLNSVIFSLATFPSYGKLSIDVEKALILRVMADLGACDFLETMLAPLFRLDQCGDLLRYLGPVAISSPQNADFFVNLVSFSSRVLKSPLNRTMPSP